MRSDWKARKRSSNCSSNIVAVWALRELSLVRNARCGWHAQRRGKRDQRAEKKNPWRHVPIGARPIASVAKKEVSTNLTLLEVTSFVGGKFAALIVAENVTHGACGMRHEWVTAHTSMVHAND